MPKGQMMFRYVSPSDQSPSPSSTEPANPNIPEREPLPAHDNADETAVAIVQNVMRAAHRLRAILNSHFGQFELTDIRYAVLQAIRESASNGCSQKDLSNLLNQTESSISTLIERMRQSGLLYRLPSTVDRRRKVLLLSELGRETLAQGRGNPQPTHGGPFNLFQCRRTHARCPGCSRCGWMNSLGFPPMPPGSPCLRNIWKWKRIPSASPSVSSRNPRHNLVGGWPGSSEASSRNCRACGVASLHYSHLCSAKGRSFAERTTTNLQSPGLRDMIFSSPSEQLVPLQVARRCSCS